MINIIIKDKQLPKVVNKGMITLFLKVGNMENQGNWHPITYPLCCGIYCQGFAT
jgi:hypothetical protein